MIYFSPWLSMIVKAPIKEIKVGVTALFLVGVIGLSACQTTEKDTQSACDLYLLIGQSNMAGRGAIENIDTQTHPRVFMFGENMQWIAAEEPMHFDRPERIGTGLGLAFGKAIAEAEPDKCVGLIPAAVGGSPISSWKPGSYYQLTQVHPYDDAIVRTNMAIQTGKLKAILWHQGESDSNARKVPFYKQALIQLAIDLRRDLNAPNIPIIVGGLGEFVEIRRPYSAKINAILSAAPNYINNVAFVSAKGLSDKGDNLHFNSASYRALGARYAKVLRDMMER